MLNALDVSSGPPPVPMPNPQEGGSGNALSPLPAAPGPSSAPGEGAPQQQQPAPNHAQTVAALRHLHAFEAMYEGLLKLPELGRSSIKSAIQDGVIKLVAERFISPAQAVMLLGGVPDEPLEQRKWIGQHMARDEQAASIVIEHHRLAHAGTQDPAFENQFTSDPDNHMADVTAMMGAHYPGGKNA